MLQNLKTYLAPRVRNYGFWVSLISSILLVLTSIGVKVDNEYVMTITKGLLSIFTILGVINNPSTESHGLSDN